VTFSLHVRVPGWCQGAKIQVNNQKLETDVRPGQYVKIHRSWRSTDRVCLFLPMPIERLVSHPHVFENTDKVALKREPLLYCVEQVDNPDFDVWDIVLPHDAPLRVEWAPNLLKGVMVIRGKALAIGTKEFEGSLYRPITDVSFKACNVQFKAIPYYAWANREPGAMTVWIRSMDNFPEK